MYFSLLTLTISLFPKDFFWGGVGVNRVLVRDRDCSNTEGTILLEDS